MEKGRVGRRAPCDEAVEETRRADVDGRHQHEVEQRAAVVAAQDTHTRLPGRLPATAAAGRRSEKERRAQAARLSQRAPGHKCVEIVLTKTRVQQ